MEKNCERLLQKFNTAEIKSQGYQASETIQHRERLLTYMERFVRNDQLGTINRPVYGRYNNIEYLSTWQVLGPCDINRGKGQFQGLMQCENNQG